MKVLFVCKKSPFPDHDGESLAISQLIENFIAEGLQVDILFMKTPKHPIDKKDFPEEILNNCRVESVTVDTNLKIPDAVLNLFSNISYHVDRFLSPEFTSRLSQMLNETKYDIIQLEGLYMSLYTPVIKKIQADAKIVLRAHNVEFEIWERLTEQLPFGLKKAYLNLQTKRLKSFEINQLNTIDAIVPITEKDADTFKQLGCKIPVHVSPAGFKLKKWDNIQNANIINKSIYHLGALDWLPNLEGIEWFLEKVWPEIVSEEPEANFYIAGRNFPKKVKFSSQKGVHLIGEVKDAKEFCIDKQLMITPLFSGSGMRLKVVEGMAAGKTIVSTKIGAEGINYTSGENILIANTAEEFTSALLECFKNEALTEKIGKNARDFAFKHYDSHKFAQDLIAFYSRI
ncbi:MAG: glycosyltransferase [Chitinophagaceae bacterium]|nr:MAG: glycosyltransferase [Chitinophagaceae bacterium]